MNLKPNPDLSEGKGGKAVWRDTPVLLARGLVRYWADRHREVLGQPLMEKMWTECVLL